MIRNRSYIPMDETRKEIPQQDLALFDLVANEGNIHEYAAGHIPAHWHTELEIFQLQSGCVEVVVGDASRTLHPGQGCLVNTGVLHAFTAVGAQPCLYRSFVFDAGIVSGSPGSVFDTRYLRPLLENGPAAVWFSAADTAFSAAFGRAFAACVQEGDAYEFTVREALTALLLHARSLAAPAPVRKAPSAQEQRIKQMLEWIDANLDAAITVKHVAAAAGVCPRECQRIFGRYLHQRPMEYVQRRRLLTAAAQLAQTSLPVTEIALNCGFASPGYFSACFRRLLGCTPGQYRSRTQSPTPEQQQTK